jgi:F420-non-reducing hydrogenase small subunit
MSKPKVAFYWCASCGGCEEAIVDLAEDILKVVEAVDIVFWPVAMDIKTKDVEAMPDGSIATTFINGAVRLSEQEEMAKLLRQKSELIVAFGSCAHLGGIPGLANFFDKKEILETTYLTSLSTSNPQGILPQEETRVKEGILTLPKFYDRVYALDQVIEVDYYLPGCAPPKDLIINAVTAILEGTLPPKGSVLAPSKSLCESCKRNESKPEKLRIKKFFRPHEVIIDQTRCFLDQGLICVGPATRDGCGARCIEGNMPCRGCFGPTEKATDMGANALSAIASLIDSQDEDEIKRIVDTIADPAGTFYRFSLPKALIPKKRERKI